jgi:hypothetical protein
LTSKVICFELEKEFYWPFFFCNFDLGNACLNMLKMKKKWSYVVQGSVVELMIRLIIWLALITFLTPNHIISKCND